MWLTLPQYGPIISFGRSVYVQPLKDTGRNIGHGLLIAMHGNQLWLDPPLNQESPMESAQSIWRTGMVFGSCFRGLENRTSQTKLKKAIWNIREGKWNFSYSIHNDMECQFSARVDAARRGSYGRRCWLNHIKKLLYSFILVTLKQDIWRKRGVLIFVHCIAKSALTM